MPYKHNDSRRHKLEKTNYRVTNWSEYNDALRKRGDITVWFTDEAIDAWVPDRVPGQKGRPVEFSALAMLRYKTNIGPKLKARELPQQ